MICMLGTQIGYAAPTDNLLNAKGDLFSRGTSYVGLGGGFVIPSKNSHVTDSSDSIVFGPTTPGISFFELTNVEWRNNYNNGFEFDLLWGYRFLSHWSVEGEFVYQNIQREVSGTYDWSERDFPDGNLFNEVDGNPLAHGTTRMNVYAGFGNIIYHFENCSPWTPYLGGGIGVASVNSSGTTENGLLTINTSAPDIHESAPTTERSPSITGTAFAWQVKLGLAYDINDKISTTIQYRLLGTTDFSASSSSIITNPRNSSGDFVIPMHTIGGLLVNGIDLGVRFNL